MAPWFAPNQVAQAYVLAVAVIVAGVAQVAVQLPTLRRLGFHFDYNWRRPRRSHADRPQHGRHVRSAWRSLQINTFVDSLIAVGTGRGSRMGRRRSPGWAVRCIIRCSRAPWPSLYYGDRLCEFPLGIVGMAVAVAIFPLLSRHADRGDHRQLGADMTLGLRLVLCLSVPAGVGLLSVGAADHAAAVPARPFQPEDTVRAARMIAWYAAGVWAYCASPVVVRGFYALNDSRTPVRIAAWMVGLNLVLNLTLIWPLAEAGLAISTSIAAARAGVVAHGDLLAPPGAAGLASAGRHGCPHLLATLVMGVVVYLTLARMPEGDRLTSQLLRVGVPLAAGMATYCGAYLLLGGRELGMLVHGRIED